MRWPGPFIEVVGTPAPGSNLPPFVVRFYAVEFLVTVLLVLVLAGTWCGQ